MSDLQQSFNTDASANPLINPPPMPHGAPPFHLIKNEHYLPAIRHGIAAARAEVAAIRDNPDAPTFVNTIEALEFAGEDLARIHSIFSNICSSNSSDDIRDIERITDAELSQFGSDVSMDEKIFARVKAVYDDRAKLALTGEQAMLLEKTYSGYVRGGALLPPAQKQRLRQINEDLSRLTTDFSNNDTKATEAYKRIIDDEAELDGVPERAKDIYRKQAKDAGITGQFLLLLEPYPSEVMTHGKNRALREEIYRAGATTCYKDAWDNTGIIKELLHLRHERAQMLGYPDHAEYVLTKRMAGDTGTVLDFLAKNLAIYKPEAEKEFQKIRDFAALSPDGLTDFKPWDTAFYSRALKEQTFNFDPEELRPYLALENVLGGVRQHAEKLFNIELREEKTGKYPVYHPDVKTYEVCDKKNGAIIGLFYADYYARPGAKQGGAWMSTFRSRGLHNGRDEIPLVINNCNFPKPAGTTPTLLSLDEVETVFHEFGHALHALLAEARYPSLAGPNVLWDFVELPSQVQENWVTQKEVLDTFARHYQTGAIMPAALIQKVREGQNFGAGMVGLRQTNLALLDMTYYTTDPATITNIEDIEKSVDAHAGLLKREAGMMSTGFSHIFAGGYSAGYYSYKWAEVLDADVFAEFEKNGLYDRDTADRLRTLYAQGGKVAPMDLFVAMMRRKPDPNAMFRRAGLMPPAGNDNTAQPPQQTPRSAQGGPSPG